MILQRSLADIAYVAGSKSNAILLTLLLLLMLVAADPLAAAESVPAIGKRYDPGIELPAGDAKALILTACTRCHELNGLAAYKGYWGKPQWTAMVESMVKNGAVLTPPQVNDVADYLTQNFGKTNR